MICIGDVERAARGCCQCPAFAGVEHADARRRESRGSAGDAANPVYAGQRRHARQKFDAAIGDGEIQQQAFIRRRVLIAHGVEIGGVEIDLQRRLLYSPALT